MELKIIHFYPDLMSLYGSYANVAVLRRPFGLFLLFTGVMTHFQTKQKK